MDNLAASILDHLWKDYLKTTPQAAEVHALFKARGETVVNDHIALRTFNRPSVSVDRLAEPFLTSGYVPSGEYRFQQKKLFAKSYSHPTLPRVFISELLLEQFPDSVQRICQALVDNLSTWAPEQLLTQQPTWAPVTLETYQELLGHSEYAAWLAAFGIRANHFTVQANALTTFEDIAAINTFLMGEGYELNGAPPHIQGTPEQGLVQSSTKASWIEWPFANDVTHKIRSCYYEFAKRYPVHGSQTPYDGFIADSADQIFESTNVTQ